MTADVFSDDQLRRMEIDALKHYLRRRLGGYTVAIKDLLVDTNVLFRGVRWRDRPNRIDQLWYPPPGAASIGRVNRAGGSIFYCSRAAPAVFYELHAKQGELIALSEWKLSEPLFMHNLGYHEDALLRMKAPVRAQLSRLIPNETNKNARLRRQLSLAFTEDIREGDEHRYKQSIAINELLFDGAGPLPTYPDGPKHNRAAGTVYPAMRMRGAADNLAIWPEFVDSSLRIKSVRYVRVETVDEASSSFTFLTLAISHSFLKNEIVWEEALAPEVQRRSYVGLEEGHWVLRDGFHKLYDLH